MALPTVVARIVCACILCTCAAANGGLTSSHHDQPTTAAVQPSLRLTAAAATTNACRRAATSSTVAARIYARNTWAVRCVKVIRGPGLPTRTIGLTMSSSRRILLKQSQAHPLWTLAHELSHAYSIDVLSVAQRASFARRLGHRRFFGTGPWATNPAEVWANNQARCAGYPNTARTTRVPCSTIRRYLDT